LAKKAEARDKDLVGAVDYVLTFQETRDIFDIMGIKPESETANEKEHSSRAGRIYARAGGVSEAVSRAVEKLSPDRQIKIQTQAASGVAACKAMVAEIEAGKRQANFFEGMGCVGGCVGGPRVILPAEEGRAQVERYAAEADAETPMENPHVIEILRRLGFETVESLLKESDIFTRKF
jgi:iron only hydrogenase large subunit-like protein